MRLTVVGCSGSVPGPRSAASCYLVTTDGFSLVLDLGSGAFGPLLSYVSPPEVGAVLLSHLHADHVLDLTALDVAVRHGPGLGRSVALPVRGPSTTREHVLRVLGAESVEDQAQVARVLDLRPLPESRFAVGPFTVSAHAVLHSAEAYALRVEHAGRVLTYSGDCAPCVGLDVAAAGADLLLVEAAFVDGADNPPGVHHTGTEAGAAAARAGAGRLVVTHVPPWYDPHAAAVAARSAYSGPVEAAYPGLVVEV